MAECAYHSNWYESSLKCQKYVLIVMMRAKEGEILHGLGFVKIDLETFKWVRISCLKLT